MTNKADKILADTIMKKHKNIASWKLDEVTKEPVQVEWFYKKDNEWYGNFIIDDIEYYITFTREDKKYNLDYTVISFKFARPDQNDPFAFSKDFNKPLVVKNTIINELKKYILSNKIDIFIIKGYTNENSRIKKYRKFSHSLVREFGFIFEDEITYNKYTYFCLFRNKQAFIDRNKILETLF